MKTSKIDRETYKRNKVKELMSLETESDNEWFDENIYKAQNEIKTENKSSSYENKKDLLFEMEDFDFNDTLSSRLDAFQEKINAMLAEGNKMLNQSFNRANVDLPTSYTTDSKKRYNRHSHSKQKVAFSSDIINNTTTSDLNNSKSLNSSKDNSSNNISSTLSTSHMYSNKTENPRKSENSQKLNGKNMLQDAISFSKLVLNNKKPNTTKSISDTKENNSNSKEKTKNNNNNSNNKNELNKNNENNENIDSLLNETFNNGETIWQSNELELLRIELKELKEKNKKLQKENMNLKIQNVSLTEKQKQQEQQIEKLKQTNSQLQRLISDTSSNINSYPTPPSSYPPSPYTDTSNQDITVVSSNSDIDWNSDSTNSNCNSNNNSFIMSSASSPSSKFNNITNNKLNSVNNGIINSAINQLNTATTNDTMNKSFSSGGDDNFDSTGSNNYGRMDTTKNIKNIQSMDRRRFSFPQKLQNSTNIDTNNDISSLRKNQYNLNYTSNNKSIRNRSNSNILFNYSPQRNKSLLNSNDNKRHSMFADIRSYDKIIGGWKSIENRDAINQHQNNNNSSNNSNKSIENSKIDPHNSNSSNTINNKLTNKRYSFVYPNNDKTKRYSYTSDISPYGEIKYDVNEYIDKLNTPDVANNKTRARKISESYANDLRRREDILKNCSLSPPVFKYSDMKDIDLMTSYRNSFSSSPERKEDKEYKRKSILDQISYIRIDDESINNIKNQVHHSNNISMNASTSSTNITNYSDSNIINNNIIIRRNNENSNESRNNNQNNVEINHLNNRLSIFKNQIQNVQKDLTDMLNCEKRIQDILIPINNFNNIPK